MITRRRFLQGAAAAAIVGLGRGIPALADTAQVVLRAAPSRGRLLGDDGPETGIWAYNSTAPGPILRARQGDVVNVRLENALDQATTIHWHGIRIDNAMDGVPDVTQAAVPPGESFDYQFVTPDAGTYWYHSHNRSWEQMARGLHGVLIVDEPAPPIVDQDLLVVLDDWRLDESGAIHEESFGHMMDLSHGGRMGNVVTLNGRGDLTSFPVRSGERVRMRLCNVANSRIFDIRVDGHRPAVVALDGQPVTPFEPSGPRLTIAPAQRVDLMIDAINEPGSEHPIVVQLGDEEFVAGQLSYASGDRARSEPNDSPAALPAGNLPDQPDLVGATEVEVLMEGGAMGRMMGAMHGGRHMGMSDLVSEGVVWALNGVAGRPEKPLFSARNGEPVVMSIVNDTAWPHAMHWHGHHAYVVEGGSVERDGTWRDTVLSVPGETMKVAFIADNPGRWLLHCHMLEHQAAGMSTWFEVAA